MDAIQTIYTRAARKKLGYYANWEPSRPLALGDYGLLRGQHFERIGSLTSLGVTWVAQTNDNESHKKFTSSNSVSAVLKAKGKGPGGKAKLEVAFGSANTVFLDAAGCTYQAIEDKRALGQALEALGNFQSNWVVVTDLIPAKRSIMAISSAEKANITFEALGAVDAIDLADASIEIGAKKQSAIGYLVDAEKGFTPFFGLCGFKPRFPFGNEGLRPLSQRAGGQAKPVVADVASELVFLQL
ncbi:hypothetical protein [Caulobacter sp. BK020]|uniref:hypothetical protein n=1 Tax=Caulobacter sp. BK020 TaxID=2512117 RepID=UPI001052B2F1|nr:hypothetical protein [Caulobacter sp. BK020]TCS10301.1 hypothetical protein EV278_11838 [Caulobacter sp. BK020]